MAMPAAGCEREWSKLELDTLQSLDAAGEAPEGIAGRLGRDPAEIVERLAIVRARDGAVPVGEERDPNFGLNGE